MHLWALDGVLKFNQFKYNASQIPRAGTLNLLLLLKHSVWRPLAEGEPARRSPVTQRRIHIKKQRDASQLTRVGIRVAISLSPLIRGSLLVEVVLRLHQRERLCEEGATAYRLVVPETAVTAALLRAVRQVKRDAPLRLEPRA